MKSNEDLDIYSAADEYILQIYSQDLPYAGLTV